MTLAKHVRPDYNSHSLRTNDYNSTRPRYVRIADGVAREIESGLFPSGARLPSLRVVCEREGVSLMTALAAYRHLEMQRLVLAEARSGYRVAHSATAVLTGPPITRPRVLPVHGKRSLILGDVLRAATDRSLVPLGLATPDPELFPLASLRRLTGSLLASDPSLWARYALPPGDARLRRAIARRISARGARVTADHVLITVGATETASRSNVRRTSASTTP
jgi:DNA-binding transcriptional MocR family regulator